MRINELIFWHKSQHLYSLKLQVLQQKSNIPTRFFPFSMGKPSTRAKMLNGNLPLDAIPTNTSVDYTLKRRGNDHFHAVSTWNPRGMFVGISVQLVPLTIVLC